MIYLDSAATTFQKPPTVEAAMTEALHTMSSPGRGGYSAAMEAAETVFDCRSELAELYRLQNPEQVVFTMNATHALNIAIKTLVPRGGRVVISGYEHNAVTRPLAALDADVMIAEAPLFHPEEVAKAFARLVDGGVSAVICSHISNVFGFIQPVEAVAALCRSRGVPLIIDDAQAAGVLPLDMAASGAAFVAMPGHKGLYGPQGTGVLLCGEGITPCPLLEGGTGSLSVRQEMPDFLPDRLEAGTHNVPGIAGLLAGIRYVRSRGAEAICRRERQLSQMAAEELRSLPGVTVYARPDLHAQAGVLSFTVKGREAEALGAALAERNIAVRSGLHCSPLAHRSAGTLDTGTVRLSFSDFNTPEEVTRFVSSMKDILA